jgi:hypothetical protein
MAGHEPPTNQEGVRAVLRGIRRTIGAAREGKAPATADVLKQMLALCPGKRDRALLAEDVVRQGSGFVVEPPYIEPRRCPAERVASS